MKGSTVALVTGGAILLLAAASNRRAYQAGGSVGPYRPQAFNPLDWLMSGAQGFSMNSQGLNPMPMRFGNGQVSLPPPATPQFMPPYAAGANWTPSAYAAANSGYSPAAASSPAYYEAGGAAAPPSTGVGFTPGGSPATFGYSPNVSANGSGFQQAAYTTPSPAASPSGSSPWGGSATTAMYA